MHSDRHSVAVGWFSRGNWHRHRPCSCSHLLLLLFGARCQRRSEGAKAYAQGGHRGREYAAAAVAAANKSMQVRVRCRGFTLEETQDSGNSAVTEHGCGSVQRSQARALRHEPCTCSHLLLRLLLAASARQAHRRRAVKACTGLKRVQGAAATHQPKLWRVQCRGYAQEPQDSSGTQGAWAAACMHGTLRRATSGGGTLNNSHSLPTAGGVARAAAQGCRCARLAGVSLQDADTVPRSERRPTPTCKHVVGVASLSRLEHLCWC